MTSAVVREGMANTTAIFVMTCRHFHCNIDQVLAVDNNRFTLFTEDNPSLIAWVVNATFILCAHFESY